MHSPAKKILLLIALVFAGSLNAQDTLRLDGVYDGHSVYIQNPLQPGQSAGCVTAVLINGQPADSSCHFRERVFEIPFPAATYHPGDSLHIRIAHAAGCLPAVLHDNADTRPVLHIPAYAAEQTPAHSWQLYFEVAGKTASQPATLEQFRWNKWIAVEELHHDGACDSCVFKCLLPELSSGPNTFRVVQTAGGQKLVSQTFTIPQKGPKVDCWPLRTGDYVHFTHTTRYEVYDASGWLILQGTSNRVDVTVLPKGNYYLNFDNRTTEFVRQ